MTLADIKHVSRETLNLPSSGLFTEVQAHRKARRRAHMRLRLRRGRR